MLEPMPVRTPSAIKTQTGYETAFYVDIVFQLIFFDPPLGAGAPGSTIQQGHNNMPFFDDKVTGSSGAAAPVYYYYADLRGDGTGSATYPSADFTTMFDYWDS
jgi:hypothetical protein